jgi:hypothetical protein
VRIGWRGGDARGGWVAAPFPFEALRATWRGEARLRVRGAGAEWQTLREDPDLSEEGGRRVSGLVWMAKGTAEAEVEVEGAGAADLRVWFIDPGETPAAVLAAMARMRGAGPREAGEAPPIVTRAQWGARNPVATPSTTTPTHLIVHHTADNPPASGDFAAWVRAIQAFHINGNGWNDIGYNFLLGPDGVIFEGRGDGILGAHFSGVNTGTAGAAILGNYNNAAAPEAAFRSLYRLLAWQASQWAIDPSAQARHGASGLNLWTISGHRDGPSPTDCPGHANYALLPQVRTETAALLSGGGPLLTADAEAEPAGWNATGMWQRAQGRAAAGSFSFYYGNPETRNYETGEASNSGTLTAAAFVLTRDATLTFRSWYETENASTLWDEKTVEISVNNGPWRLAAQVSGAMREWQTVTVPLRERGTVRVRFRFDTVDGGFNRHEGWYVDEVRVEPEAGG